MNDEIMSSWNAHCVGSPAYNDLLTQGFVVNDDLYTVPLPDDYYLGKGSVMVRGSFVLPSGKIKFWGFAYHPFTQPLDADSWGDLLRQLAVAAKLESANE